MVPYNMVETEKNVWPTLFKYSVKVGVDAGKEMLDNIKERRK